MSTICFTYVWDDNTNSDVDFVVQELARAGVQVKRDQWNIRAGKRLWEQMGGFIQNGNGADVWLIYATVNSLGSEACKEEFTHALDSALSTRGSDFPVIALFPGPVDESLMPVGPRTPLCLSLTDLEWKERVAAAADGRSISRARPQLEPFTIQIYRDASVGGSGVAIEVRPREGTWSPFFAAVPLSEKDRVRPHILHGTRGRVPHRGGLSESGAAPSIDDAWWVMFAQNEATPTQSYYINCHERPSRLAFGVSGRRPQYIVDDLQLYPSQSFS